MTILTQDQVNKLHNLSIEREKKYEMRYERLVHNNLVQDLINELSENSDE